MKRIRITPWITPWTVAVLIGMLALGTVSAQDGAAPSPSSASDAPSAQLPVTRVVLFTSGVGYFEHSGVVSGSQELELPVGTADMDDLLQSLVLQDLDGGSIQPVRYPSRDPLGRILQGYSLDLSGNPTLAELLAQARGESVTLEATTVIQGAIVNVESVETEDRGRQTWLTLSTAEGLTRVSLDEVRRIRFQDDAVQAELDAALATLAGFRGEETRTVRLAFEGTGERRVRIGYVREMPVWKTTYRLVLTEDGMADLQGWAIFDNPTDMDLRDIELAFVAGQPISFITDLYEPVYVDRPRVQVSTAPSIVPPQYASEQAQRGSGPDAAAAESAMAPAADTAGFSLEAAPRLQDAGVAAMAQGAATGATFAYNVSTPVSVDRHESAMVPIVQQTVAAHRLSIFDPNVLSSRPLRGVRLVNDTGLHLAAGTVTVFDAGGFTGNARIADLLPGESRILTYAVDLEVSVDRSSSSEPERVTAVQIVQGVIQTEIRQRATTTYRIDAVADAPRFLVIEHAQRDGFEVISPEPAPARTADAYRFGVVTAGSEGIGAGTASNDSASDARQIPTHLTCSLSEPCVLDVVMERVESRQLAVGNVTPDQIAFFLENVELTEQDRATLDEILTLKRQIATLDRQIEDLENRRQEIAREQDRIRQNMGALDRNSSLYRRYVSDLEQQEDEIDAIGTELETLRADRRELQDQLDELVRSLGEGS